MTFTPGPWQYQGTPERGFRISQTPRESGPLIGSIAMVPREGDARLVTLAPHLLAVAEALAALYMPSMDAKDDTAPAWGVNGNLLLVGHLRAARDLVAKVRAP